VLGGSNLGALVLHLGLDQFGAGEAASVLENSGFMLLLRRLTQGGRGGCGASSLLCRPLVGGDGPARGGRALRHLADFGGLLHWAGCLGRLALEAGRFRLDG
jgi:hypothetical protein